MDSANSSLAAYRTRLDEHQQPQRTVAPSQDFLRWNGTRFDPKPFRIKRGHTGWDDQKIKSRLPRVPHPGNPVYSTPGSACYPPNDESGSYGVSIEHEQGGYDGVSITRLTTTGVSVALSKTPPNLGETNFGPTHDDPRMHSLSKWGLNAGAKKPWIKPRIVSRPINDGATA